jgi:non-ribosomal peptide synthetase component F
VQLSEETTAALQGVGRRLRVTPNTLVQGAWALILSRYSGQQDVLFGAVVSGRPHDLEGVESMIGLFINTLPMRVRVSPGEPLAPWLKDVQRQQVEMQRYQYTPLVEIQGWSEVPRGRPLFESIYAFENYPANEGARAFEKSVNAKMLSAFERTSYPLTVMAGIGDRLTLKLLYDRRRIGDAMITRMLEHFKNLLEDMASDPSRPVSAFSMVTQAQAGQLIDDFNANLEAF